MLVTVIGIAASPYGIWQSHWPAIIGTTVVVFTAAGHGVGGQSYGQGSRTAFEALASTFLHP